MKPRTRYGRGSVRKRGGQWIGEWRGEPDPATGKRPHPSVVLGPLSKFKSKNEAREALQPHIEDYQRQQEKPEVQAGMTLREFVEHVFLPANEGKWLGNSPITLKSSLSKHIVKPLGDRPIASIIKADIVDRLNEMRAAGYKKQTIGVVSWLLHAIFEEALDNDLIAKTPVRRISLKGIPDGEETRPLSPEEAMRIFAVTTGRNHLMWRILVQCGLRPGELAALRRNDISGAVLRVDESIALGKAKCTKTAKARCVPMGAGLRAELEAWLSNMEQKSPRAFLFPTDHDPARPMRQSYMSAHVQMPVRGAAGIADLVLKMGRTTFATLCKGDVKDTSAMMGHANVEMTMRFYKKPIPERQIKAAEALDRMLTPKLRLVKGAS